MTNDENEYVDREMVMPFVTVASKGGPHDDDAYVAGYEMGLLEASLGVSRWLLVRTLRTDNLPQAELLAMRHGFQMEAETYSPAPEWTTVHLTPIEET